MQNESPVTRALDQSGIVYQLHVHSQPLRTVEQAAFERGLTPDQIVRSLVFRLPGGEFIVVLTTGTKRVSWPKLRQHLKASRITTARPEELVSVTGYEQGTVSPFGLPGDLRILADRGILDHEVISLGAGLKNSGIIMRCQDMVEALELEWGDFSG